MKQAPPPAVGATLIASSVVVLLLGMTWLSNLDSGQDHLVSPSVDGITLPTDTDGDVVELPPSQPATAVSFGVDGQILRPDPVRARVVDDEGDEVIVPLAPNTTVDTITGRVVPTTDSPTTSRSGSTSSSPSTRPGSTTRPPTTAPSTTAPSSSSSSTTTTAAPTTTTTAPTTTTTVPTTTTTAPTTTTTESDPDILGGLLGALTP